MLSPGSLKSLKFFRLFSAKEVRGVQHMRKKYIFIIILSFIWVSVVADSAVVVIEDFNAENVGGFPSEWKARSSQGENLYLVSEDARLAGILKSINFYHGLGVSKSFQREQAKVIVTSTIALPVYMSFLTGLGL
jgi:hypothetical protein